DRIPTPLPAQAPTMIRHLLVLLAVLLLAQPPCPDRTKLLEYRDDAGTVHLVKTPADWAKRRQHILAHMQEVMGQLPPDSAKVPLDVKFTDETKTDKLVR